MKIYFFIIQKVLLFYLLKNAQWKHVALKMSDIKCYKNKTSNKTKNTDFTQKILAYGLKSIYQV